MPTRPVFTAGFTRSGSSGDVPPAESRANQYGGAVDRDQRGEHSIESRSEENGDPESSDTDAADEDIPGNVSKNRTAQRLPPRKITSPEASRPESAVKTRRYSQPPAQDEKGLLWRRRNDEN